MHCSFMPITIVSVLIHSNVSIVIMKRGTQFVLLGIYVVLTRLYSEEAFRHASKVKGQTYCTCTLRSLQLITHVNGLPVCWRDNCV